MFDNTGIILISH